MDRSLVVLAAVAIPAAGCRGPAPIESNVELFTEHGVVRAVATEEGLFALAEAVPPTGTLSFRGRRGSDFYDDVAALARRNECLAVLTPGSSRPNLARFGAYPAAVDDELYLEVRTGDHSDLIACHLLDGSVRGDLVVLDEEQTRFAELVAEYVGAGLFAWREGALELVGVLNGVYSDEPRALAFIGLDEMSTLIPATSSFFARRSRLRRADFEYGVPRDFEGERPFASDPPRVPPSEAPEDAKPSEAARDDG